MAAIELGQRAARSRRQTREEFETFAEKQIGPLTAEVGFPAPPEITFHDVHNYDSADGPA